MSCSCLVSNTLACFPSRGAQGVLGRCLKHLPEMSDVPEIPKVPEVSEVPEVYEVPDLFKVPE